MPDSAYSTVAVLSHAYSHKTYDVLHCVSSFSSFTAIKPSQEITQSMHIVKVIANIICQRMPGFVRTHRPPLQKAAAYRCPPLAVQAEHGQNPQRALSMRRVFHQYVPWPGSRTSAERPCSCASGSRRLCSSAPPPAVQPPAERRDACIRARE
jgi:hypothetical protein